MVWKPNQSFTVPATTKGPTVINQSDNIDDQYAEAMELFGGNPIPKIGEPVEYIVTDRNMVPPLSEEYQKHLIEKYGHVPDLMNMVPVDEDD